MLSYGISNETFNVVVLNPIIKDQRESKCDSCNYRAISLCSVFSKLLDYILLDYFKKELLSSDFQFTYKDNLSTLMGTYIVKETIELLNITR